MDKLKPGTITYGYVDNDSRKIIEANVKVCQSWKCTMKNNADFQVYLKYCMSNIKECNMKEFGNIKQDYRPVAELNILVNQNIININDTDATNVDKLVDGKKVLDVIQKLNDIVGCEFDNDYDCDGFKNINDNAAYTYNPHQKDTDWDWIGDVVDDDIDNDGIKNPIGIVDDNWYINIASLVWWTWVLDNCIFTKNKDQADEDNNKIWTVCQESYDKLGMYIKVKEIKSINVTQVNLEAIITWTVKDDVISRDFGDGEKLDWISTNNHTYTKPWIYTISAFAKWPNNDAKATTTISVWENISSYHAMQIVVDNVWSKFNNTDVKFSVNSTLNFDEIEWIISGSKITTKANESFNRIFRTAGVYPVSANGYKNKELVASSHMTVWIWDIAIGSIVKAYNIIPTIDEVAKFNTIPFWFIPSDVKNILWDFGDWSPVESSKVLTTTTTHQYTTAGKKIITQKIYLKNWSMLNNFITIYVIDKSKINSYALQLSASSLVPNINDEIKFKIETVWYNLPSFILWIQQYDIWSTENFYSKSDKLPLTKSHIYTTESVLYPQATIYVDKCIVLQSKATVVTKWIDMCLEAKLNGTLKNYKCDMDSDWIPDICDDDIDGDWDKNLLWIIVFENKDDCSINAWNMNLWSSGTSQNTTTKNNEEKKSNVNMDVIKNQFDNVCSLDDCPFSSNPDQFDANEDGFWNVCQWYDWW